MDLLSSRHLFPEESGYGDGLYGSRTGVRQAKLHGSCWVPGPVILSSQDTVRTRLNMLVKELLRHGASYLRSGGQALASSKEILL